MHPTFVLAAFALSVLSSALPAIAQDASYSITISDKSLEPRVLQVKAGVKFQLTVINASKKSAEFESSELNREKVIEPGSKATIYLGPLEPGTYPFFDDFNQANKGQIVAK